MGDAHGRVGRVDGLSAWAAGAKDVDTDVGLRHFDHIRLLYERNNLDRRKAGLAFARRVERAHAHESVGACLDAQRAERVGCVDLEGGRLDACFFCIARVEHGR